MSNKTNSTPDEQIHILRTMLQSVPPGPLTGPKSNIIIAQLAECWHQFKGSTQEGTWASKLHRAENIHWDPPYISFHLERHGGTVNGSSRAELHRWGANVETLEAAADTSSYRQLRPRARGFKAQPAAKRIASLVAEGKDASYIVRLPDGRVRVILSKAAPSTSERTQSGRNKRLRAALQTEFGLIGWEPVPESGDRCEFRRRPDPVS